VPRRAVAEKTTIQNHLNKKTFSNGIIEHKPKAATPPERVFFL
jgi:hypothetical protein